MVGSDESNVLRLHSYSLKISPKFLFSLINYAQISAAQFVNLNLCDWDVQILSAMRLNPDQSSLTLERHLLSEIQTAKDTYLT